MNTATKLGVYGAGLAVVFAGAIGVGRLAGPTVAEKPSAPEAGAHEGGGHEKAAPAESESTMTAIPGGLQIAENGYQLVPEKVDVAAGVKTDFRFRITGPDSKTVKRFAMAHEKELHLIVARRDLSGFQHLHPTRAGDGVWSLPLTLPEAGTYRVFADFQPAAVKESLTLGADLFVSGHFQSKPLPEPAKQAAVDGYEVEIDGNLVPGKTSKLTLTVTKDRKPVTDLQPYLGAYGHLVALRGGDLAYLHVHPDGAPGDGKTEPGPEITFYAEVPSSGAYRLYLDFKHGDTVRTAEFTAKATQEKPDEHGKEQNDGHGH